MSARGDEKNNGINDPMAAARGGDLAGSPEHRPRDLADETGG